ncbi:hypothetical protein [Pedobacter metabolipauper]|uniref:Uncharacterized protein n=1 Tax=Pedobacter metabolipauper TaxID=425513 RepID=A0A4R6SUK9_9SPHI|nr:hypothetical protein [Pedobacter metabolipauper]TDQ08663.1 hypothetical protein ATK78_3179 [Pedobacter metabolipauper]
MHDKKNTRLLWLTGIALVAIEQLFTISISTYTSDSTSGKVIMVVADLLAAVLLSAGLAIILAALLGLIPSAGKSYKVRFLNILPIGLIITELAILLLVHVM